MTGYTPRGCSAAPSRLNSGFEAALEHPHAGGVLGGDLLEHLLEEGRVGAVGLEVRHELLRAAPPPPLLQEGAQPLGELRGRTC